MFGIVRKQEMIVGWWLLVGTWFMLDCATKHQGVSSARPSSVCTFLPAHSLLAKGVNLTHSLLQGLSSKVQV